MIKEFFADFSFFLGEREKIIEQIGMNRVDELCTTYLILLDSLLMSALCFLQFEYPPSYLVHQNIHARRDEQGFELICI